MSNELGPTPPSGSGPVGPYSSGGGAEASVCPRHPDRPSYVRCQRCERPMCPDCQRVASVGSQCIDCVNEAQRSAPQIRSVFGGAAADGRPHVTIGLIVTCALVYLGQLASSQVTEWLSFVPVLGVEEPWRYLTAAFVHAPNNILHILMNMGALWVCGQYLEPLLGRARFLALYLIAALGGSVVYAAFGAFAGDPGQWGSTWLTPTVGASGAVFGLFAAVVVLNRHLGREAGPMLGLIAINTAIPFFYPGIAWQAHLGGAAIGALAAAIIAFLGRARARFQWPALGAVVVALAAAAFALDAYVVGRAGTLYGLF